MAFSIHFNKSDSFALPPLGRIKTPMLRVPGNDDMKK
jgi:hypothetical protein